MPIKIVRVGLDDLGAFSMGAASESSERVIALVEGPLKPGETITERLKEVAREAMKLARAFQAVEAVIAAYPESSTASASSDTRPDSAGVCRQGGDPTTN